MTRLALLVAATAAVVALIVTVRPHDKPAQRPPAAIGSTAPSAPGSATSAQTPTPTPTVFRSGSATGTAVHTDYGDVQVRVTVAHRRIVRVVALELPHGNPTDVELSKPAARALAREVLRAQSADVDMVSGATYTSSGYLTSLQAALDRLS
jgi:uncharacterized protein with FMN-binding domain